jgi:hypothetical protein
MILTVFKLPVSAAHAFAAIPHNSSILTVNSSLQIHKKAVFLLVSFTFFIKQLQ